MTLNRNQKRTKEAVEKNENKRLKKQGNQPATPPVANTDSALENVAYGADYSTDGNPYNYVTVLKSNSPINKQYVQNANGLIAKAKDQNRVWYGWRNKKVCANATPPCWCYSGDSE